MDTLEIAARVHDGGAIGWAAELRYREKVMGTTWDARRSAGIRYVPSAAADSRPAWCRSIRTAISD
jgi:hypothetical protein